MKHETNTVERKAVKSASLLDHIYHLGLSKHTESYLSSKFGTTDELLWKVRYEAYLREHQPKNASYLEKPLWDALVAFDRAGYIRHDIKPEDFILNRLRRIAKPNFYQAWNCAADLEDFCKISPWNCAADLEDFCEIDLGQGSSDDFNYAYGNQRYENFTPLTEKQREEIRQILRDVLPDELTYRIICFRYSLEDGKCHPTAETALRLNRKISKIRGLMKKAYFYIKDCDLFDVI